MSDSDAGSEAGVSHATLPRVRFVDRFARDGEVYYAQTVENGVRLYRVTGETEIARSLMVHDAVIHDGAIVEPSYSSQYNTIDLYHHMGGREASIRADKFLDEPVVALEVVPRA